MRVWMGMWAVVATCACGVPLAAQEGPASLVGDAGRILNQRLGDVLPTPKPPPSDAPSVEEPEQAPEPSAEPGGVSVASEPVRPVLRGIYRDRSNPYKLAYPPFDPSAFGTWLDKDGDCRDTRNELLTQMSSGQVWTVGGGCEVRRGQWLDPYTGKVLVEADDVGIDHLVPLFWAWQNGAWTWDDATRERFANDTANMYVVEMATIRAKAQAAPNEWMPPDAAFHCAYATRFERIRREYELIVPLEEQRALDRVREAACAQ